MTVVTLTLTLEAKGTVGLLMLVLVPVPIFVSVLVPVPVPVPVLVSEVVPGLVMGLVALVEDELFLVVVVVEPSASPPARCSSSVE